MGLSWLKALAASTRYTFWSQKDDQMWSCLPDTALVEIYLCLPDHDRLSMSLTCKNWNNVFSYPCLWRTRYIELGGYKAISAGERACKFADSHGDHVRYLFLSCTHPSSHSCKVIQMTIDNFLFKIQNAKLLHFELVRLNLDRFWKFEHLKEKIVHSFARFLLGQRNMLNFDMGDAHFSLTSGCRILEAIGSASGSTIKDLDIEDFFHSRLAMFQVKRFRNAFAMFTNLSCLSLNYNCLSDEIFECLAKTLAGKLKNISCTIYRTDPHYHRISSFSWKNLKAVCPSLTVDFWFESIGMSVDINRILVPEAPVREMHLWTGFDDSADWQLGDTINHIAAHHKQIGLISMELDNNRESVDGPLVAMVRECKGLRELYVNAVLAVATIDEICELQTDGKIDLHTFHVTTCGLTELECAELLFIKEKHLPVMQQRGLDFKMSSDYYTDSL
ncbi:F-box only protein 39-like [Gigantopelta aegis]|uniref:F-box only protein 39-like n=1 Tax=Gigantopelta aegis TaxID=1735272 RepID=UPI001B888D8B|nr:F-box only protein 39-like [Gigantopelta aegis]